MRAFSVRQPWARAIVAYGKDVENRPRQHPWHGAAGERLALHVSTAPPTQAEVAEVCRISGLDTISWSGAGRVIATLTIIGVHHADECITWEGRRLCSPWAQLDSWHLNLENVEPLAQPYVQRGRLGLFEVPGP